MLLGGLEVPLWFVLGLPAATLAYYYSTRTFGVFKESGIPGPKPWPIIGTMMETYKYGSFMANDTAFRKQYGKLVATFEGSVPVLMVMDPDFLKEAFIKNFAKFTDRRRFRFGGSIDSGLFSAEGAHWKYVRQRLSPEFSSGKLKKMMPAIRKCDDIFVTILRNSKGESVDIRRRLYNLTLDVISSTAFGIDTESQTREENNPFSMNAKKLLGSLSGDDKPPMLEQLRVGLVVFMTLFGPDWCLRIMQKYFNLGLLDGYASAYFDSLTASLVEERKKSSGNDFIQTLTDSLIEDPATDPEAKYNHLGNLWTRKGFTKQEIMGNTEVFLSAGFQTTADTMLFVFYEMAHNQDTQQKLYEDIVSVCDTDEITIDQVAQLKYLDYCISEAMRLYPQGFRFDRVAAEDVEIQGIKIAKGTAVTASPWVMQRDSDYFENPEEFQPERFSPENFTETQASAYMPFGLGNRQCIGNRLALLEMKVTLISTLKEFTIETNKDTPKRPLEFQPSLNVTPITPIMLTFAARI